MQLEMAWAKGGMSMERLTSARPWEEAKEDLVNEPGYSFLWQRLNAIEKVLGKDYDLDRLKEIVEKSTRPAADVVEVVMLQRTTKGAQILA